MLISFYRKIFFFALRALALVLLIFIALFSITLYGIFHSLLFYYAMVGFLGPILYLGFSLEFEYEKIKSTDYFREQEQNEIDLSDQDVSLQVFKAWLNGATYQEIEHNFQLDDNKTVYRHLKKAGSMLLKSYATNDLKRVANN